MRFEHALETLGVSPGQSREEVRLAYLHRIAQYHPDRLAQLNENLRRLAENEVRAIDSAYSRLIENLDVVVREQNTDSSSGLVLAVRKIYGRVRSNW